ncbi:MAG: hypothetical protein ACOC2Y_01025 [Spirochaetota bacterium]
MHDRQGRRFLAFILVTLCALLAAAGPALAQTAAAEEEVFAPFVSRLRLSIRDPQIRITWEDATDIVTSYRVYRATEQITIENLPNAELVATVSAGVEAYIDIPPEPNEYYYAVLAERSSGAPYRAVIPGRNASFRAIEVVNVATEIERAAEIGDIGAALVSAQGQTAIEVTATSDRDGRTIIFYRSTDPITSVDDLEQATVVREAPSGAPRIVDLPVPGVQYYYAALDTGLLLSGDATVTPGMNATRRPTEIPLAATADAPNGSADATPPEALPEIATAAPPLGTSGRGIPLPYLQIEDDLLTGLTLGDPRIIIPNAQPMSAETEAVVAAMLQRIGRSEQRAPGATILPDDRIPEPEGAEYTLRTILDGPFRRMAWESALEQLENYFTLPLTAELEARAHFYRAQIYYFMGEERRAILELLLARDHYYVEVEEWLGRILGNQGA